MMKKKQINTSILFLILSALLFACDDFIEKDIEKETINLLAPGNNLKTVQLTHTFWWDWIEGAEEYNIQIVEGTFSSAIAFVLDSTTVNNQFVTTLYPGSFQWKVRGLNNGYETLYTTFNLTIDSTLNISSLSVILTSPTDLLITNNNNISFAWNTLLNADDYLVEIRQNTFSGGIVYGPQIETNTTTNTVLGEGTFVWGVQARNATSNSSTAFSTRTIIIDTTAPNPPILNLPVDNASLTNIFNAYTWTQGANTGTALIDAIYFYTDAAATQLLSGYPKTIANGVTSSSDSLGVGIYYWAVQSTDAANNSGFFSTLRKVTITP